MNFSLFAKISHHDRLGYNWFLIASIPLALLFFLSAILDRVVARIDTLPEWLSLISLLGVVVLVPVAMQVNKMNDDREGLIVENSPYTWKTYGFLAMFIPIFLVVLYGSYLIIIEMV